MLDQEEGGIVWLYGKGRKESEGYVPKLTTNTKTTLRIITIILG